MTGSYLRLSTLAAFAITSATDVKCLFEKTNHLQHLSQISAFEYDVQYLRVHFFALGFHICSCSHKYLMWLSVTGK